jgi:hypothetical protein
MTENKGSSTLREMVASGEGDEYVFYSSLLEAQRHPNGVVILEGDWGGQIYLVIPANQVSCSEETLHQLLLDIDAREWPNNEPESSARVCFERRELGEGIAGGMGGGVVRSELWVHPRLASLTGAIAEVLAGQRGRLVD